MNAREPVISDLGMFRSDFHFPEKYILLPRVNRFVTQVHSYSFVVTRHDLPQYSS